LLECNLIFHEILAKFRCYHSVAEPQPKPFTTEVTEEHGGNQIKLLTQANRRDRGETQRVAEKNLIGFGGSNLREGKFFAGKEDFHD
jgi:hypothetical protein